MALPINFEQFAKDPLKAIMFLVVCAVGYLYADNKMNLNSQIEKCDKNVKEVYLVDAMSVTEAEARVVQEFSKRGYKNDFSVVGAKSSNVVDIIYPEK